MLIKKMHVNEYGLPSIISFLAIIQFKTEFFIYVYVGTTYYYFTNGSGIGNGFNS